MPVTFEWALVAVMLSLGPYPVVVKSYPAYDECVRASQLADNNMVRSDCVRVAVPQALLRERYK